MIITLPSPALGPENRCFIGFTICVLLAAMALFLYYGQDTYDEDEDDNDKIASGRSDHDQEQQQHQ
jgi:hypothetical protein